MDMYNLFVYSQAITAVRPQRRLKKNGIDYTDDYDTNETVLQNFLHFHNRPIVKYCYNCVS
jgi:hypothetical protein